MTYPETIQYLYDRTPAFQHIGPGAYKEGLSNTLALDAHLGHPHRSFRTIHVAGTNGKGSCSHTLAAILQAAGYRTGLYTSPHLLDFSERIRIDGQPIEKEYVVRFVEKYRTFFEPLQPSFFEVTTALAFLYFADKQVDVAVVEVGLGGRLDCTNIITPDLSIITNISLEHTALLGDTLARIAGEKAGIIKEGIPVVIGSTLSETRPIFVERAAALHAPIRFAEEEEHPLPEEMQLKGAFQVGNAQTVLTAIDVLQQCGYRFDEQAIRKGFAHVCDLTGLRGRWQTLREHPTLICDIGHNPGCMPSLTKQLDELQCHTLRIVLGFAGDKDTRAALSRMPFHAVYYITRPSVSRALDAAKLLHLARCFGLDSTLYPTVVEAVQAALADATPDDCIFVGGSTFVVADLLQDFEQHTL